MSTVTYRGSGVDRPAGLPLPPARMPLLRGGRQRKRWRYVGVYGPELMLCVGAAQIGPAHQGFWAVWDRERRVLRERTTIGRLGGVRLERGRARVDGGGLELDLALDEGPGIEVVCPAGRAFTWTRKQAGVRARGALVLDDVRHELDDARAVIDESAGYHDRHTRWTWSAGVGASADGRELAWNLVAGINDPAVGSERTVWVDGEPHEVAPVRFAQDLSAIAFGEGGELRFAGEAVRERDDNLLVVRSRYRQPFGTFAGTLPGGIELAQGYGVMELHDVLW